jgi:hypothetical protein
MALAICQGRSHEQAITGWRMDQEYRGASPCASNVKGRRVTAALTR